MWCVGDRGTSAALFPPLSALLRLGRFKNMPAAQRHASAKTGSRRMPQLSGARHQPALFVKTRLRTPRPWLLVTLCNQTCLQRGQARIPGERAARLASSRARGLSLGPSRIFQANGTAALAGQGAKVPSAHSALERIP